MDNPTATRLRLWAAALSIAAALIHGIATPEHLEEWWGYGLFFIAAAMAQGFYGFILFLQPWRYDETGAVTRSGENYARLFYFLGVAGNVAIVILYIISRTVGIPFFGPEAGEIEPITPISVISKVIEIGLIGCLVALIRMGQR